MKSQPTIQYLRNFSLCSREHFSVAKGIAAVLLLLAYVAGAIYGIAGLKSLAGVAGAIFLFCSGYGVSESFQKKGGLQHYWENKILKVWLPSLVIMIIISALRDGEALSWINQSVLGLSGYFLYILFGCYAAFWGVFCLSEKNGWRIGLLMSAALVAFIYLNKRNYAELMLAFPLGVTCSQLGWRKTIKNWSTTFQTLLCAGFAVVAVGGYFLTKLSVPPQLTNLFWLLSKTAAALFAVLGAYVAQKLPVFGAFAIVGDMSYGIYLLYADVLSLRGDKTDLQSMLIVLGILVALAALFSWLRELLIRWNKKIRRRKNPKLKGAM